MLILRLQFSQWKCPDPVFLKGIQQKIWSGNETSVVHVIVSHVQWWSQTSLTSVHSFCRVTRLFSHEHYLTWPGWHCWFGHLWSKCSQANVCGGRKHCQLSVRMDTTQVRACMFWTILWSLLISHDDNWAHMITELTWSLGSHDDDWAHMITGVTWLLGSHDYWSHMITGVTWSRGHTIMGSHDHWVTWSLGSHDHTVSVWALWGYINVTRRIFCRLYPAGYKTRYHSKYTHIYAGGDSYCTHTHLSSPPDPLIMTSRWCQSALSRRRQTVPSSGGDQGRPPSSRDSSRTPSGAA